MSDPLIIVTRLFPTFPLKRMGRNVKCRPQPFTTEAGRMVFLFELYEKHTAGLFVTAKKKKKN